MGSGELRVQHSAFGEFVRRIANWWQNVPLWAQRMTALGLDAQTVEKKDWLQLEDVKQACAHCGEKHECADDLAQDPSNPIWEQYCPNAKVMKTLADANSSGQV